MRYKRGIVRQVLDIMEEGPLPLRDAKPAEKVKTVVELFQESNQGNVVSDSRVDLVQTVHEHNSTYPKMQDELDKRHSTSKATVFAKDMGVCTSKSKLRSKQRKPSKIKYERQRKNTRKNKEKRGVDKKMRTRRAARKFSSKKTFPLCTCNRLNVGCQCSSLKKARNRMSGTDDILTFDLSIPKSIDFAPMDVFLKSQSVIQPKNSEHGGSITSLYRKNVEDNASNHSNYGIASVENPDTSDPSISSYNSFASTGHEPMV